MTACPSTRTNPNRCRMLGINIQVLGEYWRFDRTRGDFYGEPLAGDRLVNGEYCPVELTTEPDGFLKGYSPALHLSLCWQAVDRFGSADAMLAFYNHQTGEYLRNLRQSETRIQQLEEQLRRRQQ